METNDSTRAAETARARRYVGRFDWDERAPASAVVASVAKAEGCEAEELDTLYDYIDPDALNELVDSANGEYVELSFAFDAHRVTVRGNGNVFVEPDN